MRGLKFPAAVVAVLLSAVFLVLAAEDPSVAPLPYRGTAITVDGSLREWRDSGLGVTLTDPELTAPESNHVVAHLAWDLDMLYVAFSVTDEEVFDPPVTAEPPELFCGDSVEVYVDVDGDAGDRMDGRDFQFIVACDGRAAVLNGDPLLASAGFLVPKRVHDTAVFKHVVSVSAIGFAVELGIPWPTLGIEVPTAGAEFGVDLAVNDWIRPFPAATRGVDESVKLRAMRVLSGQEQLDDEVVLLLAAPPEDPTTADGYFAWSWSGTRDLGYPSQWVRLELVGGPSLVERLDRRLGALRVPMATLGGAGLFTLVAALVIRVRERQRVRGLMRRISELEQQAGPAEAQAESSRDAGVTGGAASETPDTGKVPVTTEISGRIETVRRLVRQDQPVPPDLVSRAIACVLEHLDEGITPSELAERLFVSLRTLQRAVASSLGCSPSELIMVVRLREAYRMLRFEQRSVKDVALSAAFASQPHFSRKFKHYFRINPSEVLAGDDPSRAADRVG